MRIGCLLVALPLLVLSGAPSGAEPTAVGSGARGFVSQGWNAQNGLPHDAVLAVSQTRDGYLWLATHAGLARFDGLRFRVFNSTSSAGLLSSDVRALALAKNGSLWIGTFGGGVSRLAGGTISHVLDGHDALPASEITALLEDDAERLWIGTPQGLALVEGARVETFGLDDGLPSLEILSLGEDREGRIYVGTSRGVAARGIGEGASFERIDLPAPSPVDFSVEALLGTDDGALWIGTAGAGLFRLSRGRAEPVKLADGDDPLTVRCLLKDTAGRLWVGTTDGVLRLGGDPLRPLGPRLETDRTATSLFQDREQSLWLGTHTAGLRRLRPATVTGYTRKDGLPASRVRSVTEDPAGDLWIASDDGVLRLRGRNRIRAVGSPGDERLSVRSVLADGGGTVWLGTTGQGLARLRDGRIEQVGTTADLGSDTVSALFRSDDGILWIGTEGGGLSRLRDGRIERLPVADDRLSRATVTSLVGDPGGGVWVGTLEHGLLRCRDGLVLRPEVGDRVREGVLSLGLGERGSVWIGTLGGGLLRLRDGEVQRFALTDDLPLGSLHAILDDHRGYLWIATNRGVFRVAKSELDELADGGQVRLSWRKFGAAEGLPGGECTGGGQPTAWRARDGRLWFATVEGVGVIDPDRQSRRLSVPPVVIERVMADGRSLAPPETFRLPLGTSRLEVEYTVPTFTAPERVRFRTRLVGFDREWVLAESRRVATYTSLAPGEYTFEVAARLPDGAWSHKPTRYSFSIPAPFYRTPVFEAAVAVFLIALVWGLYRLRIRRLHVHQAVLDERHRVSRDVHDSLSQGLTGIVLQLETAERLAAGDAAAWNIQRAREIARANLGSVQRVVAWLRCDELGEMRLDQALRFQALKMAETARVAVEFQEQGKSRKLPRAMAEDVYRVVGEALTNALRHAEASLIQIRTVWGWRSLTVIVQDDGVGMEPPPSGRTLESAGLRGMQERAELWRGRLEIDGRPGEGTRVSLKIPLSVVGVLGSR
ncbi:MAG: two-component regulator propeller domain-containing protein [Acidobacteriota bacterium]|jgi:ligand-binding sensor domain-containing protein/signal transduction histidine kinase